VATSKWCNKCFEDKTLSDFSKETKALLGRRASCIACRSSARQTKKEEMNVKPDRAEVEDEQPEAMDLGEEDEDHGGSMTLADRTQEAKQRNQARRDSEGTAATSKWCGTCFEDKALDDFKKAATSFFGRRAHCKACLPSEKIERTNDDKKAGAIEQAWYEEETDATMQEDEEETETDDDEAKENESGIMTAAERTREAMRRNQARRDALEGGEATTKWCTQCLEDVAIDEFKKHANKLLGRDSQCSACR
jgi:hypothetical protein